MADISWGHGVRKYWTGSGDYGVEAGRRYDSAAAATPEQEIEQKTREAREAREATGGAEGDRLQRADEIDRERTKAEKL